MIDPIGSERLVDRLVGGDTEVGETMVVEELLQVLADELDRPGDAPTPAFLEQLVAAVPSHRRAARRGLHIVVASGVLMLGAAGSAAAAGGSLPGPIQSVVHEIADTVGIDIPDAPAGQAPSGGGSQDGEGNGRSDEAPGRPEDPGRPDDPSRADEAPGQPEDPGSDGVGPDGVPPGQVDDDSNAGGNGVPNPGGEPAGGADPSVGGNGAPNPGVDEAPNLGGSGDGSGKADDGRAEHPNVGGAEANSAGSGGRNANANQSG